MRITILTIGTLGDVQPYVALGVDLQAAGHRVKIATHEMFRKLIETHDLEYSPVTGNVKEAIQGGDVREKLDKKRNTLAFFNAIRNAAEPLVEEALKQNIAACQNTDHVLVTPITLYMAFLICRKLDLPMTLCSVNPAGPTREYPNLMMPEIPSWLPRSGKNLYNAVSHLLVGKIAWHVQRPLLNKAWKNIFNESLPVGEPVSKFFNKKPPLILNAYSEHVLPRPKDWIDCMQVTGYWYLKNQELFTAPKELTDFMNAGEPPVYIGFGSMNSSKIKSGKIMQIIAGALKLSGQRAVVLRDDPEKNILENHDAVYLTDHIPFDWLFPKMKAIVHHGGAGTCGDSFRSGVPTVLTPLISDQRFWAARVEQLGVGPKPIPWNGLTAQNLASSIKCAIQDKKMQQNAQELCQRINSEDGVLRAVELIDEL